MFVAHSLFKQQGVCHTCGLAIYIIKKYLKAKEELIAKPKYFTMQKIIIFKKSSKKKPKCFKIL
jgi:hypothetical protein